MALTLVTTLPPQASGAEALRFAHAAWLSGAEALELRSDLHAAEAVDAQRLAAIIPLMISERGARCPRAGQARPASSTGNSKLRAKPQASCAPSRSPPTSRQADGTCPSPRAVDARRRSRRGLDQARRKPPRSARHRVAAAGDPATLERRVRRSARHRSRHRTLALPFRCLLAARNAFDYLAFGSWSAAEGQRLLGDAVRDRRAPTRPHARRAILGSRIAHSRSPQSTAPLSIASTCHPTRT